MASEIFCKYDGVTAPHFFFYFFFIFLGGLSIGHQWIPLTKASDAELWCLYLICVWTNGWANNRGAGVLRRHRAYHDVTVMQLTGNKLHRNTDEGELRVFLLEFNVATAPGDYWGVHKQGFTTMTNTQERRLYLKFHSNICSSFRTIFTKATVMSHCIGGMQYFLLNGFTGIM